MSSNSDMKQKVQKRYCFVPGCNTGYRSCKVKYTLFSAPKDADTLQKWDRLIPRGDKKLTSDCTVCEIHFDESYVERNFRHIVNGEEVLIPRQRPTLKSDAIPTIFPNLPKYLSKTLPKKRTPKQRDEAILPKKIKLSSTSAMISMGDLCDVRLPSKYWVKLLFKNSPSVTAFATWDLYTNTIANTAVFNDAQVPLITSMMQPDKLVIIEESLENTYSCTIFVGGANIRQCKSLETSANLETILSETDLINTCCGAGRVNEFFKSAAEFNLQVKNMKSHGEILKSKCCSGEASSTSPMCLPCKFTRKVLLNKRSKATKRIVRVCKRKYKLKVTHKSVKKLKQKVHALTNQIVRLGDEEKEKSSTDFSKKLNLLSHKQRLAVNECFKASHRKSTHGMSYDKEWLLECIIMRMKSPRLYEHMRLNKILVLPSRTYIQKSLKAYKGGFGFNAKTFSVLKEKSASLDSFSKHGNLLFDELKLSENLQLKSNGIIQGYVDYGTYTPNEKKHQLCDHGLVLLFQPFIGDWVQIVGVFATRGNMKGNMLAKILTEAIIYTENAGLYVDAVTGDGASWNRAMWKEFGVGRIQSGNVKHGVPHPCDEMRTLYFISDFPHLLKCLRNSFLKSGGFLTPHGEVRIEFIKAAWKADQKHSTLKAMPKLTRVHIYPNNFEKMRVSYAFQLFSEEVVKGLSLYEDVIALQYGNTQATITFFNQISQLILIMTSRLSGKGLRENSKEYEILKDFLNFLSQWENHCGSRKLGFLSKGTTEGFKVTICSTLSLVQYLSKEVGYKYLLTSRLSQDKLENLFSIIRQSKGCNDHPTPSEFLNIVQCLSYYNLARTPRGGNALPSVINSLISPSQKLPFTDENELLLRSVIDALIEKGSLSQANKILNECETRSDHKTMFIQRSDSRLIHYVAGYVVRKFQQKSPCESCRNSLKVSGTDQCMDVASFTKQCDKGGLMYPSEPLFKLIFNIENKFTECFSCNELHRDSILDVIHGLEASNIELVGCREHQTTLTEKIVRFFIFTRMHFHLKQFNRSKSVRSEKIKYLKMRRCK